MTATLATALTVDTREFASGVAWAAKTIAARPQVPVLAGVLVKAEGGRLTLSGFDYDSSTSATVQTDATVDGAWLVSGRLLESMVKSLDPKRDTTFEYDGTQVVLRSGRTRFTLPTMPVEDYPALPGLPDAIGTVNAARFAEAVQRTAFAVGDDASLPFTLGVRLQSDAGTLKMSATDRYRVAIDRIDWAGAGDLDVVVHGDHFGRLAPLLADAGPALTLSCNAGLFGMSTDTRTAVVRLVDMQKTTAPDVDRGFPKVDNTTARVDVADLRRSVERAALVLEPKVPVVLAVADGEIEVSGSGSGTGDDVIDAETSGDPMTIRFNHQYLLDALKAVGTARVDMWFDSNRKPVSITSVGRDGDQYRHVVMPVRPPSDNQT